MEEGGETLDSLFLPDAALIAFNWMNDGED